MFKEYDDILTVDDLCEILKIGKTKTYMLLRQKHIPGIRIENSWRVSKNQLYEWLRTMKLGGDCSVEVN